MNSPARRGRVGILISGRGSNMVALVRALGPGAIPADAALVLSNEAEAGGLARAAELGVPTAVVAHRGQPDRAAHERAVLAELRRHEVDVVCLAGYMRRVGPTLLGAFPQRMFNVHPSLLPAFPGLDAQRQALEHGVRHTGCTVHLVDEELDCGPIVLQATVPVFEEDTVESLSARILAEEHRIYPQALALHYAGRLVLDGRRVRIAAAG